MCDLFERLREAFSFKSSKLPVFGFIFASAIFTDPASAQIYSNSGNNTTGFIDKFDTGTIVSDGTDIVEATGGTWDLMPFTLTGNFQISFQVYNDSYDGDSHILLLKPGTTSGVDVRNSPEGTDTPSINIFSGTDFTNYFQYFFPTPAATLATATSLDFPNLRWTQVTIARNGNTLIDNVGGQIITANINGLLSNSVQVGLGGYATAIYDPNPGNDAELTGELLYRNFVATPEPRSSSLLACGIVILFLIVCRNFLSQKRLPYGKTE